MKYLFIVGICILGLVIVGASNRLSLSVLLNEYEEECLQYDYQEYNRTEYYCDSWVRYLMMCYTVTDEGEWIPQVSKDVSFDRLEIDCNCPEIKNRTVIAADQTDTCLKYHLIKKTKPLHKSKEDVRTG